MAYRARIKHRFDGEHSKASDRIAAAYYYGYLCSCVENMYRAIEQGIANPDVQLMQKIEKLADKALKDAQDCLGGCKTIEFAKGTDAL